MNEVLLLARPFRHLLATDPRTSLDVLRVLACDEWAEVRAAVAWHPRFGAVDVRRLMNDPEPMVRAAIAAGPCISPAEIATFAGDASYLVRAAVARRRDLRWTVLLALLEDVDAEVRVSAAATHPLPVWLLDAWATSAVEARRQVAAAVPNLPSDLQRRLAGDVVWEVRRQLLRHIRKNQPLEAAATLALAPEFGTDDRLAGRLVAQLRAGLAGLAASAAPRSLMVALMRSAHPCLRAIGRRLSLANRSPVPSLATACLND